MDAIFRSDRRCVGSPSRPVVFVAVSVNVSATLGPQEPLTRRLAEQAFHNYLIVLFPPQRPSVTAT